MLSPSTRQCFIVDVKVPFEDRVPAAAEPKPSKSSKYHVLRQQILSNGYACFRFTVAVGCREITRVLYPLVSSSWV
jgi:hypothetical protein